MAMNCRIDVVMGLCCKISENMKMKARVGNSAKGLLGGALGIFLGGTIGGALGGWMTSDEFQPLHQIIIELPPQQKKKLYDDVMAVLGKLDWIDLPQLLFLVMGNSSLHMRVVSTILTFATKELGCKVQYEEYDIGV